MFIQINLSIVGHNQNLLRSSARLYQWDLKTPPFTRLRSSRLNQTRMFGDQQESFYKSCLQVLNFVYMYCEMAFRFRIKKSQRFNFIFYIFFILKIRKGAYQLYSLKPPDPSFLVGRCKDLGVRNKPCCEHGKPCRLWHTSIQGNS